jgi:hypothetical protein
MIEDIIFNVTNYIFNFIFWIILDRERFWTAWWAFLIINLLFAGAFFRIKNDNEGS